METVSLRSASVIPGSEEISARGLKDTLQFGMVHFSLPPGAIMPMHSMPFEVCFMVLAGKGTLTVDDESFDLMTGYRAVCSPQTRRGWRNYGTDENLDVLVIKIKSDREVPLPAPQVGDIFHGEPAVNPHGVEVRRVYESEHAQCTLVILKPGEELLRHITPVDAFFFVIAGTGLLEIGDEKETFRSGTLIDSPVGIPHCWYNRSDTDLRILVLKVPKPTLPTQFV